MSNEINPVLVPRLFWQNIDKTILLVRLKSPMRRKTMAICKHIRIFRHFQLIAFYMSGLKLQKYSTTEYFSWLLSKVIKKTFSYHTLFSYEQNTSVKFLSKIHSSYFFGNRDSKMQMKLKTFFKPFLKKDLFCWNPNDERFWANFTALTSFWCFALQCDVDIDFSLMTTLKNPLLQAVRRKAYGGQLF